MFKGTFQYLYVINLHEVKELKPFLLILFSENYRCHTDREINNKEEITVLVQIDEKKDPDDNERVGTIKFKGPAQEILGVYDQLKPWMDDHWLPKFNLEGGKIYCMHNSQHVHRSKLPGINQVKENYADQLMTRLIIIILLIL